MYLLLTILYLRLELVNSVSVCFLKCPAYSGFCCSGTSLTCLLTSQRWQPCHVISWQLCYICLVLFYSFGHNSIQVQFLHVKVVADVKCCFSVFFQFRYLLVLLYYAVFLMCCIESIALEDIVNALTLHHIVLFFVLSIKNQGVLYNN